MDYHFDPLYSAAWCTLSRTLGRYLLRASLTDSSSSVYPPPTTGTPVLLATAAVRLWQGERRPSDEPDEETAMLTAVITKRVRGTG
jgi:hypothetical protein